MLVAVIIKVVADIYGKYLVYMASDALLPCRYQSLSAAIDLLKIRQSVQDISCDTVSVAFRHKTQLPDKVSMKIKAMQEQKTHRRIAYVCNTYSFAKNEMHVYSHRCSKTSVEPRTLKDSCQTQD